jgi:hypothetical protein
MLVADESAWEYVSFDELSQVPVTFMQPVGVT